MHAVPQQLTATIVMVTLAAVLIPIWQEIKGGTVLRSRGEWKKLINVSLEMVNEITVTAMNSLISRQTGVEGAWHWQVFPVGIIQFCFCLSRFGGFREVFPWNRELSQP